MDFVAFSSVFDAYLRAVRAPSSFKIPISSMAEKYLQKVYYDPAHPAGFGGLEAVYRAAAEDGVPITRHRVAEWLKKQETYTLHKPARKSYPRNRVMVSGIDIQWQADLADLSSLSKFNQGYRYILTCIDIFSKYAWAIPLKTKSASSLLSAFQKLLSSGRKPIKLQTDMGTEFNNQNLQDFLREKDIRFFTTYNETKASVVERFNRTLKSKMWKYFTANNTLKYIDVLPKLMKAYNSTWHRSIRSKPKDVTLANEEQVRQNLYGQPSSSSSSSKMLQPKRKQTFKFHKGDTVRISMLARPFRKGYLPQWTEEIFTVANKLPRSPPVYKLKDYDGEELEGTFYEAELQRVDKPDDVYRVERVLRKRRRKDGTYEYFVKWFNYPEKFNSWVSEIHKL